MQTFDLDGEDPRDADARSTGPAGPGPAADVRARPAARWPYVLLAVVLVAAGLLFLADQRLRQQEFEALLVQVQRGQSTVSYSDARLRATVDYASPALFSPAASEKVRASLRGLVQNTAAQQASSLDTRRQSAQNVQILWWHSAQRHAQDTYVLYLSGQTSRMNRISVSLRELFTSQPAGRQELAASRAALLAASTGPDQSAQVAELVP